MKESYVYILCCDDGSYYTGVTSDWRKRLQEHQNGIHIDAYTYDKLPVELVYLATFTSILDAIAWEKKVKRWRREKKEALIKRAYGKLPELAKKKRKVVPL